MRTFSPILQASSAYAVDRAQYASLTPTVNTWDYTTNAFSASITVPAGEKWLTNVTYGSYVAGPNAPMYQCFVGIVFTGAFSYVPPVNVAQQTPFCWSWGIAAAGDNTYFDQSGTVILPSGTTKINFAYTRDAGAITLEDRRLMVNPIYSIS